MSYDVGGDCDHNRVRVNSLKDKLEEKIFLDSLTNTPVTPPVLVIPKVKKYLPVVKKSEKRIGAWTPKKKRNL